MFEIDFIFESLQHTKRQKMSRKWNPSDGGQLVDFKEVSKKACEEQMLSDEEAEFEADYKATMIRMKEYEDRRYSAEDTYFAMTKEADDTSLPFFADRDCLTKWLDLLGLNDDPNVWFEEHKARFPQFYGNGKSKAKVQSKARSKDRVPKGHKHHQVEVELEYDDDGGVQVDHFTRKHEDDDQ